MRIGRGIVGVLILLAGTVLAADPFSVEARLTQRGTHSLVEVSFGIPAGHHLYADTISVNLVPEGNVLAPFDIPKPARYMDAFSDAPRDSYTNDFKAYYAAGATGVSGLIVEAHYQGCSEAVCFFPGTRVFRLGVRGPTPEGENQATGKTDKAGWRIRADAFTIAGRAAGYLRVDDFLSFLDSCEGRGGTAESKEGSWDRIKNGFGLFSADPVEFFRQFGVWWTILAILFGGILLNLTPCVLPMIPVNLAIIGAGAQGSSRARGFALGGIYGLGMALVYGVLGSIVVLTGSQFGALNSMPWFNLTIAVLFVALGLAMFDVITIDFTRFQGGRGTGSSLKRGGFASALVMGGVAALLAGACVAPVVIAVLVLSGNLYAHGARVVGLALPFVLGWGMALPWPLAGSGLAWLPKPGAWMTRVKYGFGVFILLFALYYASLAYHGWVGRGMPQAVVAGMRYVSPEQESAWEETLAEAQRTGKPIFVDFWATWCKNCEAMDATTFRTSDVRQRLAGYLMVKFQAEKPNDPATKAFLDYYGVKGLPTYVVLKPPVGDGERRE